MLVSYYRIVTITAQRGYAMLSQNSVLINGTTELYNYIQHFQQPSPFVIATDCVVLLIALIIDVYVECVEIIYLIKSRQQIRFYVLTSNSIPKVFLVLQNLLLIN